MQITSTSTFIVTEKATGKKYYPKGLYWHKKNLILIAPNSFKDFDLYSKLNRYPVRWSVLAKDYDVEITE